MDPCKDEKSPFIGCLTPPDPKLVAEGWQRRFIADERMARDAVEAYTALGFEVKLVPLKPQEFLEECNECRVQVEKFHVVYTRKTNYSA